MNKIVIAQLSNGDNIIGVIENTTPDGAVTIEYPMSLMLDPMSGGLGMMPYLSIYTGILSSYRVFDHSHIVSLLEEEELSTEIVEKYKEYKEQVLESIKDEKKKEAQLPGLED